MKILLFDVRYGGTELKALHTTSIEACHVRTLLHDAGASMVPRLTENSSVIELSGVAFQGASYCRIV